jgi:DnaK suppressor protein
MQMKHHLLSWDQRRTLRERLNERAALLRAELRDGLHAGGANEAFGMANRRDEVDDEALADLQSGLDVAAAERDAAELAQVMEALARIDSTGFGKCADCGVPIAWARLVAQPQARHCLRCASARERGGAAAANF